jgi:hypothetical protein
VLDRELEHDEFTVVHFGQTTHHVWVAREVLSQNKSLVLNISGYAPTPRVVVLMTVKTAAIILASSAARV